MKYFFTLFLTFLLFTSVRLYGQRKIRGALSLGTNLAQVDGDEKYGFYKRGLHIGPSAIVEFTDMFYVSVETLYSQMGAYGFPEYYHERDNGEVLTGEYRLRLDYVKVPVLFHLIDKRSVGIAMGASYGRLVNVKEWEHSKRVETTALTSKVYAMNDYDFITELRVRLYKEFWFGLRYSYSIAKIRTRDFYTVGGEFTRTRDQYNNSLAFRITYIFNDFVPFKKNKKKK